ncbi:ABC transporter ATP-binding protein [Maricaulis sp.]|uniref:ABC transporter ATP-binding protein n=1 Tax=Maricaulis sp. TaxID=1486257 RepID=UPI001B0C13DC|nr:ABC transporter ATP-binding protein [Maricaulis sp.]MBO6797099.1 ABC transporter ATP-binding protein [Maricaulis sp.]
MSRVETLSIRGARRAFTKNHAALESASLELHAGEITALLGASGSGKSTLLRAVAGLEQLDAGEITADGVTWTGPKTFLAPEQRRVGLVFQDYALFPHMTAVENVAFGLTGTDRKSRALDQLRAVELEHKASQYPHELSGGEQQRVALARALAPRPGVVLLDEPFSGLDRRLRGDVRQRTMDVLRAAGTAVLFVTHDAEEALESADQLALMDAGRIIQCGAPQDVWFNPVSETAARLVGDVQTCETVVAAGTAVLPLGTIQTDLPDGTSILALIRPQAVRVVEGDAFSIVGTTYSGPNCDVTLKAKDGTLWTAKAPATQALCVGDKVSVNLDPAFVTLLER